MQDNVLNENELTQVAGGKGTYTQKTVNCPYCHAHSVVVSGARESEFLWGTCGCGRVGYDQWDGSVFKCD